MGSRRGCALVKAALAKRLTEPIILELLLVEGLEMFGMGNWEQIAEHIGTKTRLEVAEHYEAVYVKSQDWPSPVCFVAFDEYGSHAIDKENRHKAI